MLIPLILLFGLIRHSGKIKSYKAKAGLHNNISMLLIKRNS